MPDAGAQPAGPQAATIGRDHELTRLTGLLGSTTRLINVSGPIGSGRKALVRAALRALRGAYDDVHEVRLAGGQGAGDWLRELARSVGAAVDTDDEASLRVALAGRVLLMVDDAGGTVSLADLRRLTEWCPDLQLVVVTIAALPVDDRVELLPLARADAVQLFAARAVEIDPSFRLDDDTAPYVERICAAVDGLPLALQVAAARLSALPLPFLAREIDERRALAVLSHADPERIGVRDCLELTCTHLTPSAAALFDMTGVFAGPFGLAALVDIAGRGATAALYDDLSQLVELRLLERVAGSDGEALYRLRPLVRELAEHRLTESGRLDEAARRHGEHYSAVARHAAAQLADGDDGTALAEIARAADEPWAALERLERRDPVAALRLAADLAPFADQGTHHERCRATVEGLLGEVGDAVDAETRCDAVLADVSLSLMSRAGAAVTEVIVERLAQARALARTLDQPLPLLRALSLSVLAGFLTGAADEAYSAAEEGIEASTRLGHARWLARFEAWSAMAHIMAGRPQSAARLGEQALQRALRVEDDRAVVVAGLLLHQMPPEAVRERAQLPSLEALLKMAERLQDLQTQSHLLARLAGEALEAGETATAARWVLRRLELVVLSGAWNAAGFVLMQTVRLAVLRRDDEIAAQLHGAVAPMLAVLSGLMGPAAVASYEAGVAASRKRLGSERFDLVAADRGARPWDQALALAKPYLLGLAGPARRPGRRADVPADFGLTPRELQVLGRIALGHRNKEIAAELEITAKSVMHHSVAIYRKLGVRGRSEAAVVAVREGLVHPPS